MENIYSKYAHKTQILFLVSFAIAFLYRYQSVPQLSVGREMWAESGTNYYYFARIAGIWENLKATDSGYLPIVPRLVALGTQFLNIPLQYIPRVYQLVGFLFISFCTASFVLPVFGQVLQDEKKRFVLSLALLFIWDYELLTFINFSYYAMIPLFFVCLIPNFDKIRFWKVALSACAIALVVPSKAFYLAFFPVLGLRAGFGLIQKRWKETLFFGLPSISLALSAILILQNAQSMQKGKSELPFVDFLAGTSLRSAELIAEHLFGRLLKGAEGLTQLIIIAFACLIILLIFFRYKTQLRMLFSHQKNLLILLPTILVALATVAIKVKYDSTPVTIADLKFNRLMDNRQWFSANIALFSGLSLILLQLPFKKQLSAYGAFGFLLLFSNYARFRLKPVIVEWPIHEYSNWRAFVPVLKRTEAEGWCVPLNPYPWFFSYNCNYLSSPPPAKELVTNQLISLQEKRKFELPAASREKSFLLIGLPLRETTCKKLRLDFLSPTGESVGIAKILEPRGQVLSFFIAEKPPASASQFEINSEDVLCSPEKMGKIVQQKSEPQPLAIWMGR